MDAGRAGHLRDAGDGHFHVGGGHQHEVGEFVNDDDDVAELFGDEDVVVARHDDFLVHLDCEPVRAGLDFFLPGFERQFRFGSWQGFVLGALVERFDVANADLGEDLVAFFHFVDDPAEGKDDLLGIVDDRHDEVGQRVVLLQFDHLRIDHHEAELVRREPVEQRGDDGVDANRFAGASAAGDEQVRHLGQVGDNRMAVHVLAEREGKPRPGVAPFIGLEQIADDDLRLDEVGNLHADGTFSRHRRQDVNAFGFQRGGNVVIESGDFFELHAGRWMQFVAGDRRAFGDVAQGNFDVELGQRLLDQASVGHQVFLRFGRPNGWVGIVEQVQRRQLIITDQRRGGDSDGFLFFRGPGFGRRLQRHVNDRGRIERRLIVGRQCSS